MKSRKAAAKVRQGVDLPVQLHDRIMEHKDETGESLRAVLVKGAEMYLDGYHQPEGEKEEAQT